MEFWGAEVKPGKPLKVASDEGNLIHISQATLDCKGKLSDSVLLTVTVDGKKLVIGTLSQDKFPQISFDLVFEREFELSHNCTKGSVHFIGYKSPNIDDQEEGDFSGSEEEEEDAVPAPVVSAANGTGVAPASNVVKAETKPKAKVEEVKPEENESDEDSDEEDESDEEDDSEKGMDVDSDDSDDSDEESEDEEETPQKPEPSNKKRPNESASKTPVSGKKAKPAAAAPASTPQKTEEKKKGGHTATPHPAKKGGKTPVNANQIPKSGGQSSGGNKKPFNSGKQFGGSNSKGKGKGKGRA